MLNEQNPALLAIFAQFEMSGVGPLCAAAERERDEALLSLAESWKRRATDQLTAPFLVCPSGSRHSAQAGLILDVCFWDIRSSITGIPGDAAGFPPHLRGSCRPAGE